MADISKKEAFRGAESTEVAKKQSVEVKESTKGAAVESADFRGALGSLSEGAEDADAGAEAMGHVSESSSEGKERKGDGHSGGSAQGDDEEETPEQIIQRLINSKPTKKQMLSDIKRHFKKERRVLHRDLKKYEKQGDWYRYNRVVERLRKIRETFSNLAHATYDALKNVWLKVVHGIV